jgi:apolipoprotein N-acyltransferase
MFNLSSRPSRFALAALTGVAIALSFPSFSFALLAFVALVPLLLAVRAASGWKEAFLLGELSLAITWLINMPWVVNVMSKFGGLPYPLGVAIFILMSFYLAIFGALFAFIVWNLRLGPRFLPWLAVPLAWSAIDYARTHLLTGSPWNLLGTALVDYPQLAILSAAIGPYGTAAAIVTVSTVIAWLITNRGNAASVIPSEAKNAQRSEAKSRDPLVDVDGRPNRATRLRVIFTTAAFLVMWFIGGSMAVTRRHAAFTSAPQKQAAMLQPNISQEMRWNNDNLIDIFSRMQQMTDEAATRNVDVVLWPESTVPLAFFATPFFREYVEEVSRSSGTDVILGSVAEDENNPTKIWNAAYLVSGGRTEGRYDKIRLVPFGEYVPLRKMLFFAEKLVRAVGEFQFGTNEKPLAGKHTYGPAICYEVMFPGIPMTQVRNGATVLVTITNDAWFGQSAAPWQHLIGARMRAIETDRFMLRAATTGVSALIDPNGRLVSSLPLDRQGIVYGAFAERKSITPYVRFGDWFAILSCIATALAVLVRRKATLND